MSSDFVTTAALSEIVRQMVDEEALAMTNRTVTEDDVDPVLAAIRQLVRQGFWERERQGLEEV